MSDFAKKWGDEYNKLTQPLQGKGSSRMSEQLAVVQGSGPLLKSLIAIDNTDPETKNAGKEREKLHKALEKEMKGFQSAAAKYGKLIDAAVKKTDKSEKDAYRALKALRAHLDHISASVEHKAATTSKAQNKAQDDATARIDKETDKARKKGMSDAEVKDEVDYSKQLRVLVQFATQSKTAATNAKNAVQAIKSDPTPKTYNEVMFKGGRNYTQVLGNLLKLSKDPKCPPKVKELAKGLDKYKSAMDSFGSGDLRSVAVDTSEDDILAYNKQFVAMLKGTYPYAEKMQAYLKKNKLK